MRELTELELWQMAEEELEGAEGDWPIISKVECDSMESAVCIKQTKLGYVLGVSCDQIDAFKIFYSNDFEEISTLAMQFETEMRKSGNPLSGAVVVGEH